MNPHTLHHSHVSHARIRKPYRSASFLVALLFLLASLASIASAAPNQPVAIQLLSVSDWHAQLDPLSVPGIVPNANVNVGGAAALSSYFKADRAANPNTLTLTGGDAFGGSPPLSNFFNEEPAVKAMNLMGFDADALGNHNFDRGIAHLQQMIDLADFTYVSANLKNVDANLTGVEAFKLFDVGGIHVAVIGITNPEAPSVVRPGNFGTIEVTDPIAAANKARAAAQAAGAKLVIAITHLGVEHTDPATGVASGPLIDFANNVGGFDVIFGDHTDVQYSGIHNNALVVENRSKGRTYSKTMLNVDPISGRISHRSVEFVTPLSGAVTPDPAIVEMLDPYRAALASAFDGVIGNATGLFPRGGNIERLQEVALGNLVTDAMRWRYGTQLAFTNAGGLRTSLPSNYLPADKSLRRPTTGYTAGPPYDLVVGDVFSVLPFGNVVVTRTVTGAQLYQILEHSVSSIPGANGRFGQVSGFRFTYDASRPAGTRVVSVALADGTPILPDSMPYTFATNDFVNSGGDGYTMLAGGQGVTREVMADVVLEYIRSLHTITPAIEGRISRLP
ncbi:MAG: 5'-nucleotidase C-terminal domain-containing protein [Chloroflexota bacterium]|nr:5'-nucleotidase C-terminal domain-containing protein [Chloroflexota bacterium]PLS79726.1 MAG: bifunctional metallophosphatase/5'-nucleotidase [Chloroflexota bacterium]